MLAIVGKFDSWTPNWATQEPLQIWFLDHLSRMICSGTSTYVLLGGLPKYICQFSTVCLCVIGGRGPSLAVSCCLFRWPKINSHLPGWEGGETPVEGRRVISTRRFPSVQEGQGPDFVPQRHFLCGRIQPCQTQPKLRTFKVETGSCSSLHNTSNISHLTI